MREHVWFKRSVVSDIFEVHTLYNIAISCIIKSTNDCDRNVNWREGKIKTDTCTHTHTTRTRIHAVARLNLKRERKKSDHENDLRDS